MERPRGQAQFPASHRVAGTFPQIEGIVGGRSFEISSADDVALRPLIAPPRRFDPVGSMVARRWRREATPVGEGLARYGAGELREVSRSA